MKNRVLFFIDILGFSNFVKSEECTEQKIDKFNTIISTFNHSDSNNDIHAQAFSDTIVISLSEDGGPFQLGYLFDIAEKIQLMILHHLGLLTRGIIHIGKLIHNDNFIFGEGLVDAYNLEQRIPYPAFYFSQSFNKEEFWEFHPELSFYLDEGVLGHDCHGLFVLPTLIFNEDNKELSLQKIKEGKKSTNLPHHLAKWCWLEQELDKLG